jgi:hypothetical protein
MSTRDMSTRDMSTRDMSTHDFREERMPKPVLKAPASVVADYFRLRWRAHAASR